MPILGDITNERDRADIMLALAAWFKSQDIEPREAMVIMSCALAVLSKCDSTKAESEKDLDTSINLMRVQLQALWEK